MQTFVLLFFTWINRKIKENWHDFVLLDTKGFFEVHGDWTLDTKIR